MNASVPARRLIVIGGTSEIALAIVRALAEQGRSAVALLGRDPARLQDAAAELRGRGCEPVRTVELDADAIERHEGAVGEAFAALGGADVVIVAIGLLGERGGLPADVPGAIEVMRVNFLDAGSLLIRAAARLQEQRHGTLVVLSSVAGERVRRGNVVYGAAKAGLDALAQGLGDALHEQGVRVMVVRPGFVRTRMTAGLRPAPFAVGPDAVARAVLRGLERGEAVVWAPRGLRWLMLAVRSLPRSMLRRVPL